MTEEAVNIFVPDYYPLFRCKADRCRHTCCAGWEIDVDRESLLRYRDLKGPLGEEIRRSISKGAEPHFLLDENGRCPMLTEDGLCRMILAYGEGSLCQICRDHPRFRNYWHGRIEIGLGLVCEEAAALILGRSEPMKLICIQGNDTEKLPPKEKKLLAFRNRMMLSCGETGPKARLWEYLVYRHMADALYDGLVTERIAFIRRAYRRLTAAWGNGSFEDLCELTRIFSDKVEYDSEVLEKEIRGNGAEKKILPGS